MVDKNDIIKIIGQNKEYIDFNLLGHKLRIKKDFLINELRLKNVQIENENIPKKNSIFKKLE